MIALIDAEYLIYHAAWNSRDMPVAAPTTLRGLLRDLLKKIEVMGLANDVILCSSDGSKLQKKEKYPRYKAKRKDDPAITETKSQLRDALNVYCITESGYEADDIIYSIHKTLGEERCLIVSPDKDLRNIPGNHWNPRTGAGSQVTEDAATRSFWMQMLTGDSSDNIPGIHKVGEKTAERILQGCVEPHEYEKAVRDAYHAHGGDYEMNHYLLSFLEVPVMAINHTPIELLIESF